jgi:hypothetical protein
MTGEERHRVLREMKGTLTHKFVLHVFAPSVAAWLVLHTHGYVRYMRMVHIIKTTLPTYPSLPIIPVQSYLSYFFLKPATRSLLLIRSNLRGRLHILGATSNTFPIISPAKYLTKNEPSHLPYEGDVLWKIPAAFLALVHRVFVTLAYRFPCSFNYVAIALLAFMALRKPPGRAEKSISFLCCDHSSSDWRMDS